MITAIEVEGFLIFKDRQRIDLSKVPRNAVIGILGLNLDAPGYESNASGKSSFINIISWILFDYIAVQVESKDLTKDSIINDGSKKAIGILEGILPNGNIIKIQREKSRSAKSFNFWINGELEKSNTDTDKQRRLFEILGFAGNKKADYTDFLNTFYFTGELTQNFASKNFSDQKRLEIVTRIKKINFYVNAIEIAKNNYKGSLSEFNIKTAESNVVKSHIDEDFNQEVSAHEVDTLNHDIAILESELKKEEENLEIVEKRDRLDQKVELKKKDIEIFKNEVQNFAKSIEEKFNKQDELKKEIKTYKEKIKKLEPSELKRDELNLTIKAYIDEYEEKLNSILLFNKDITTAENQIHFLKSTNHLGCPICHGDLTYNKGKLIPFDTVAHDLEIRLLEKEISKMSSKRKEIEKESSELKVKIDENQEEVKKYSEDFIDLKVNRIQLNKTQLELKTLVASVSEYVIDGKINPDVYDYTKYGEYEILKEELDKLSKELLLLPKVFFDKEKYSSIHNKISDSKIKVSNLLRFAEEQMRLREQLSDMESDLIVLQHDMDIYDYWVQGFKDLKNLELMEIRPILQTKTNEILQKMGTNIDVQFDIDVEKNGLSIELIEDSGVERPLGLFSTGQSTRIGIASGLALRDLALFSNINIGFTLWDEVLDGLDSSGMDNFFSLLKTIPGLKFTISHNNDLKNQFQYVIQVTRKNHKSNIELIEI